MNVFLLLSFQYEHILSQQKIEIDWYATQSREPPTCFLIAILLIYLGPFEMPACQHRPVSLVADPQAWLQPQVCFHLGKKRRSQPQRRSFLSLGEVLWSHFITFASLRNSSRMAVWPRHLSTAHRCPRLTWGSFHLPLNVFSEDNLGYYSREDTAWHMGVILKHSFPLQSLPADTCSICMLYCWLGTSTLPELPLLN